MDENPYKSPKDGHGGRPLKRRDIVAALIIGAHPAATGIYLVVTEGTSVLAAVMLACGALFFWFAFEIFRRTRKMARA